MIGAGTFLSPLLKLIVTVGTLAAVYFFIVAPVLDTTEKTIDTVGNSFDGVGDSISDSFDTAALTSAEGRAESYANSLESFWPEAARQVNRCVKAAGTEVAAMEACADQGQSLTTAVQPDRSFALSYAESLEAQGDAGGAQQVIDCVEEAGFKVGAMQDCRELADELLFG